jgi:acetone carboxylase, beta subunit
MERSPRVLAIDAGGTMTDTFIVDDAGEFVVGKAQTTPEDESEGFMESSRDALKQWDSSPEETFPLLASGIFSGTAMLNRLLSRQGRRIGAIVSAGQEDYLRIERGIQTYLGYSYSDRLHIATHHHNPPLIPRERVKGVRRRIDVLGLWKMHAPLLVRDTDELLEEIYPRMAHCDPEWMELREFYCPLSGRLLETEAVTPGYPVVHEFLPDIEGFYRGWLGREIP